MDIRKLQRAIVDGLEDVKAQHIVVFNTEAMSPLFERVVIATGASNRQTKALAASVRDAVRSRGMQVMRTEGEDNGEWIIVDCGAAVVHIMQPAIREYYHLEEIWGGKPVKMKLGAVQGTRLVKASDEPPHAAGAEVSARYLGAGKSAAGGAATAGKPRSAQAAGRKVAAPKAAERKPRSAAGQGIAAKTAQGRAPAAKTTGAVRKLVVGPAPGRKSAPSRAGSAPRKTTKSAAPKRRP